MDGLPLGKISNHTQLFPQKQAFHTYESFFLETALTISRILILRKISQFVGKIILTHTDNRIHQI